MAITVYTYNDKVLKNVATDKWLKKKEGPAGFVMDASNATISGSWIYWQSPAYPNGYNGNGKSYTIVNNNNGDVYIQSPGLMYLSANNITTGGPAAIPAADMVTGSGTMKANSAGVASGYGTYLGMTLNSTGSTPTAEQVQTYASNLTITILDP
jgi:hypothetical protein